ncbi:uncharacterized protein [Nicotiana sylvestris]|uniref:uncharacterized protein n=1 Tax=Nicotiana sylvestris TaxID=4096 RepID=UPI00388C7399
MVPKDRKEYSDIDRKSIKKNYRANKILVCGIGPDEYNRVSACDTAKEIWEVLQTAHEGTTQVKQSKIDMLTTEYELFRMKDDESIQDMYTRFTSIINELHLFGDVIPQNKLVWKILSVLLGSWESKMVQRNGGIPKRGSSSKAMNNDLYYRCRKPGHFIKDCSLAKQEQYKQNPDKVARRNLVPDKQFNRKSAADKIVKQALAAWGDSSSESEREPDVEKSSMMAVETEATKYDSLLDNDKETLTIELGEAEQSRDDLVETIEGLSNEKHTLEGNISATQQERDDFLVIITNLEETIEGLNKEHRTVSLGKGKEVANATQIKLEHKLNDVKTCLCGELEKNWQLQAELEKVKIDLEKSLKWTWSSNAVTTMYLNISGNWQGIGFQQEKTLYNPHSKNNVHFKESCQARVQSIQKHKVFTDEVTTNKGPGNGYILRAGKVGKSLCQSIENVYYVDGLSQSCVKGNKVEFLSKECTITNLVTDKVVLVAKRNKTSTLLTLNLYKLGLCQEDPSEDKLKVVCIRSDHGTECDNAKFDELVTKMKSHTTSQHQGLHSKMVFLWTGKALLKWFTCHVNVSFFGAQESKTQCPRKQLRKNV